MAFTGLSNTELVSGCIAGKGPEYWQEFVERTRAVVGATIYRVAQRWGECRTEVFEDLFQETYFHLLQDQCKILQDFQARCGTEESIFGFLKVVAANLTHDHFRAQHAKKRDVDCTMTTEHVSTEIASAILGTVVDIERTIMLREIDEFLDKIITTKDATKQKAVFWLYYKQGMTASAIAALPHIDLSTKGVESLIFRLTGVLRKHLSALNKSPELQLSETKMFSDE